MKEIRSRIGIGDCLLCSCYFDSATEDCVLFQEVSLRTAASLLRYAEKRQGARVLQDCDVAFENGDYVRSGIVFVREHRRGIIGKRKMHGAPDLAVEIACECSARELRTKKRIYSELKVREIWIVYPESETVKVLAWTEAGYVVIGRYGRSARIRSPLLPDLILPLSGIFRRDE